MKSKSKVASKIKKSLDCKYCKEPQQVPENVSKITCWRCTMKLVDGKMYKTLDLYIKY